MFYLTFGYLIFNTLYNKKKKTVFRVFAFLPKVFLAFYILSLVPVFTTIIHYRQLEDYKSLEIKDFSDIQSLTNLDAIYYYKSADNEFTVIVETKYENYISVCDRTVLEILDKAGMLDEKLIPQEISDISKILMFMIILGGVSAIFIALFVNDKKNIIFVLGLISFFIIMIFSTVVDTSSVTNFTINT